MNSVRPTSGGSDRELTVASSCSKKTWGRNFTAGNFGFSLAGWTAQLPSDPGKYPQATGEGQT